MKTLLQRLIIVGSAVWFTLNLSAQTTLPSPAPERNGQFTVSTGKTHSLALGEGNILWSWGSNASGQLGNNSLNISSLVPVQVVGGGVWAIVSAGEDHSLAVRQDGSLWSWGNNDQGQLGDGTIVLKRAPVRVGNETGWVAVAAGPKFSLALKSNGRVYAWGQNNSGQLGFQSPAEPKRQLTPRLVLNSNGSIPLFSGISAGSGFSLALGPRTAAGSSLYGWGNNQTNQLGLSGVGQVDFAGNSIDTDTLTPEIDAPPTLFSPLKIGSGSSWVAISAGDLHSLALIQSGEIYSWGVDILGSLGQTGNGSFPQLVSGISNVTHIAAAGYHSLAISGRKVWGWGANDSGQLGIPNYDQYASIITANLNRSTPTLLSTVDIDRLAAGSAHSLIFGPSTFLGVGKNNLGQLGNGITLQTNGFTGGGIQFGLPDLSISNVTILNQDVSALLPGDTLSLRITVKNNGTSGVESGFVFLQARFSSDDSFDLTDPLLAPVAAPVVITSRISGGGEVVQDFNFTIPSSLSAETYFVSLRVDDNFTLLESNETNNDFLGSQSLRFLPNLTVLPQPFSGTWKVVAGASSTSSLSRGILGGDVAVAMNALNGGTGPFGSQVSVTTLGNGHFQIRFNTLGNKDLLALDSSALTPARGQVRTVTDGSVTEFEVQELFLADSPLTILTPTTVSRGSSFSANLSVFNTGATPYVAASQETPAKVKLFLTLDSTLGNTDDIQLSEFTLTSDLAALGGSTVFSTGTLTIPRYLNPGVYRFGVSVDHGAVLAESVEGDNLVYLPSLVLNIIPNASTVSLQDALDITFKSELGATIPASTFTFAESGSARWFGESNVGSVGGHRALVPPLLAGQTASFSISLDGPFKIAFDWQLDSLADILSFTVDGVAPTRTNSPSVLTGQSQANRFEATIGSSNLPRLLTWTYTRTGSNSSEAVLAVLDAITITPLSQPDLLISQLSFNAKKVSTFVLQDLDTPLDVVILGGNFGKTMASGANGASAFDAEVRLSKDQVWGNADDVVLGKLEPIQSLDASNRFAYSQFFDLINCIPEGAYFVAVKVDSGSSFQEFDESNNIQFSPSASVLIEARPNLQVSSRKINFAPGMYTRRQLFPVEFSIINSGCKDINVGDLVNYNVSLVGALVANDGNGGLLITYQSLLERALLSAQDPSGLKAGSLIKVVQNFRIPNYMERQVIGRFSRYTPLENEIIGRFCDFDITSPDSSETAINDFYFGNRYLVPSEEYPLPVESSVTNRNQDLPLFDSRGPVLFGVKVGLSSNVPLVKSETLLSKLLVSVIATRTESVTYDYFRRFWSMRWNQLDSSDLSSLVSGSALAVQPSVFKNPFAVDVGDRTKDPDADGFTNEQEFVFGTNPWVSNRNLGQSPVTLGLIESGGTTDGQGQVILAPTSYLSATFNVSMQHPFKEFTSDTPVRNELQSSEIGQAPLDAHVSNANLTYIVEAGARADFADAVEVFRINPGTSLNTIEGDVGNPLRLLPHTFNPNVVGVTDNGSTIRVSIVDKTSVNGFSTRFMRVVVKVK